MNTINGLNPKVIELKTEQEKENTQRAEQRQTSGEDVVNIDENARLRLEGNAETEEPISYEEALASLDKLRSFDASAWSRAHRPLDHSRVAKLLRLDS